MIKFLKRNLKLILFIAAASVMNLTFAVIDILTYTDGYAVSFSVNKWRHYTVSTSDYYFSGTTLKYVNDDGNWVKVNNVEIDKIECLGGR